MSHQPRNIPAGTPLDNPLRVIREIESQLKTLDETQQKIAFEIPDGPQRLRGLAGTGKTVLLAKRAATIHIKYPDWKIAFIFFTRSLYDQVTDLISLYHREMHPVNAEPNFNNLQILHSWGARDQNGFYRKLALACGRRPRSVNDVQNEVGRRSPAESFEYVCNCLENEVDDIPEIYDALLIDEGQDLPFSFYRLAYSSLKAPKRLYWAYDEAQGIGSLLVPEASEIFGRDSEDNLIVDLRGSYEGGILKGHRMNKCYRTPKLLLMVAHSINMGLFREAGALQGVTRRNRWEALGYSVEGNFNQIGSPISITRKDEKSPHPIDNPNFQSKEALGDILKVVSFNSEFEEQQWIAQQVAEDIQQGFNPWDIMITALVGDDEYDYLNNMRNALQNHNIAGYIAGTGGNRNNFRIDNHVTISNIFRAKGNEAWKVYVCRFHYVNEPIAWRGETELHKRNEAFVALTRSRVWSVLTGIGDENTGVFAELDQPISQFPTFTFPAFNQASLRRQNDTDDLITDDLPLFSTLEIF